MERVSLVLNSASPSVYGGFDRCGLAAYMAPKNIRAVVLKEGGKLPFAPALTPSAVLPFISRDQNALETLSIRLEKSIKSLLATCTQH